VSRTFDDLINLPEKQESEPEELSKVLEEVFHEIQHGLSNPDRVKISIPVKYLDDVNRLLHCLDSGDIESITDLIEMPTYIGQNEHLYLIGED
jgi:DNA-directed RNA polymerase alpha subunit